MTLRAVPVEKTMDDYEKIHALALEAFPKEEYLSPDQILEMTEAGNLDFWALYDETFVGFMVVQTHKTLGYLFFLAIDTTIRSKGYGSLAIHLLKTLYPDKNHVVDLEMIEESAPNLAQRKKRREFYLRNGYKPTNHYLSYLKINYEILAMDDDFDFSLFKEMMATINLKDFAPRYFQKKIVKSVRSV